LHIQKVADRMDEKLGRVMFEDPEKIRSRKGDAS